LDANLIITYEPTHKGLAEEEVKAVLKEAGEENPEFIDSGVDGLFLLKVSDGKEITKKVLDICKSDPSKFDKTFHWIPIETWCESEVEAMQNEIKKLVDRIGENEKWKLDLGKRQWDKVPTNELIIKLTDPVDRPNVDLENPEKIIEVQIIGDKAGISLVTPDEIVNVPKIKGK